MLVRNSKSYPDEINEEQLENILEFFKNLDEKYEGLYGKFYEEQKKKSPEVAFFLEETPPDK